MSRLGFDAAMYGIFTVGVGVFLWGVGAEAPTIIVGTLAAAVAMFQLLRKDLR